MSHRGQQVRGERAALDVIFGNRPTKPAVKLPRLLENKKRPANPSERDRHFELALARVGNAIVAVELLTHETEGEDREDLVECVVDLRSIRDDVRDVWHELRAGVRGAEG